MYQYITVTFKLRLVVKPSELKTGPMLPSCTRAPKPEGATLSKAPTENGEMVA